MIYIWELEKELNHGSLPSSQINWTLFIGKKSEQDGGRALGDSKQGLPCSPTLVSILLPTIQYFTYLNCSGKALR